MFYSIIIPCYNAKSYLKECIDSILKYPNNNFEVLAINDGSSDNTLDILNCYTDSRLHVINQENIGQYKTWKNACKLAKGDYIIFMDSDDVLTENIFSLSDDILIRHNVDLIQFRYQSLYPNHKDEYKFDNIKKGYYSKEDLLELYKDINKTFIEIPKERWAKTIKKDKLMFIVEHSVDYLDNFEDVASIYVLLKNIDSMYVSNEIVYSWRKKKTSVNTKKEKLDMNYHLIVSLNDFFAQNKEILNLTDDDLNYLYLLTYKNYYYFYAFNGYYQDSKKIYKIKKFKKLLHHAKLSTSKGNLIVKIIYRISNFFLKHNMMHIYISIRKMYLKETELFDD